MHNPWARRTGAARQTTSPNRPHTAERCKAIRAAGDEPMLRRKTGLVADAYFSATKLAWLLDEVPHARRRAAAGELAFGTVDSWLVYRLRNNPSC